MERTINVEMPIDHWALVSALLAEAIARYENGDSPLIKRRVAKLLRVAKESRACILKAHGL